MKVNTPYDIDSIIIISS
jgi:hypothetical protein